MRAFVVVGPSCAGAEVLADMLCARGAMLLHAPALPGHEPLVVVLHEIEGEWRAGSGGIDLAALFTRLRGRGYAVNPILVVRDPSALARDQVTRGTAASRLDAEARIRAAYSFFFTCLAGQELEWFVVSLEGLAVNRDALLARLGMQPAAPLQEVA